MKTAELTGALLDYWVAMANAPYRKPSHKLHADKNIWGELVIRIGNDEDGRQFWNPHKSWEQGGPLIDTFDVTFEHAEEKGMIYADAGLDLEQRWMMMIGPDRLTAAMRAIVASVYGDEVPDIPVA